ncbi:uncharacterized protein LOC134842338 [Symsagittifera roscoffensis]|uniref:uncharacterized protein LOC134842338 n=1 Tax=Symsagittifera roscoffensis TaxID=84072 RepID=UPI00307C5175
MPVPRMLAQDVEKASETNETFENKIQELPSIKLDPSLEGATSLAFIGSCSEAESKKGVGDRKFVCGHGNGAITIFKCDAATRQNPVQTLKLGSSSGLPIMKVLPHPTNPDLIFSASVDGNIYQSSITKHNTSIFHKEEGNEPMSLCFCDDVTVLISAGRDTHVRMYDPVTNQITRAYHGSKTDRTSSSNSSTCRPSKKVFALKESPSHPHCFYSAGWDNSIKMWDCRTSEGVISSMSHKNSPHVCGDALDVKVCGGIGLETILTASWTSKRALQLWEPNSDKLLRSVRFPSRKDDGEYLYSSRFVNDSVVVAGGSGSKDAVFINFHTSEPLLAVGSGSNPITAIDNDVTTGLTLIGGTNYDVIHLTKTETAF